MIRKSRERRVAVIQKVGNRIKLLVVRDVFQVMILAKIRVEANSREPARLTAGIKESELLNVGTAGNINQHRIDTRCRGAHGLQ